MDPTLIGVKSDDISTQVSFPGWQCRVSNGTTLFVSLWLSNTISNRRKEDKWRETKNIPAKQKNHVFDGWTSVENFRQNSLIGNVCGSCKTFKSEKRGKGPFLLFISHEFRACGPKASASNCLRHFEYCACSSRAIITYFVGTTAEASNYHRCHISRKLSGVSSKLLDLANICTRLNNSSHTLTI